MRFWTTVGDWLKAGELRVLSKMLSNYKIWCKSHILKEHNVDHVQRLGKKNIAAKMLEFFPLILARISPIS